MPRNQVAHQDNLDFGAPPVLAPVAQWNVLRGDKVIFVFEAYEVPITVSINVAPDNATWAALTVNNNGLVVTNVAIPAYTQKTVEFDLRAGVDAYLQLSASGSGRGGLVYHHHRSLEKQNVPYNLPTDVIALP